MGGRTRERPATVVAALFAVLGAVGFALGWAPPVSAQDAEPEPVDSPEYAALNSTVATFECPVFPGFEPVGDREQTAGSQVVDGVRIPQDFVQVQCDYQVPNVASSRLIFTMRARWIGVETLQVCPTDVRLQGDDGLEIYDNLPDPDVYVVYGINFTEAGRAAIPNFAEVIAASVAPQVAFLSTFAAPCQFEPLQITCPEIDGLVLAETGQSIPKVIFDAVCNYEHTSEDNVRSLARMELRWATSRSDLPARAELCYTVGEQYRPNTHTHVGDGIAAEVIWQHDGTILPDMNGAAAALREQVRPQAASCEGTPNEPMWTPLPAYLADTFAPERVNVAATIGPDLARATTAVESVPASTVTAVPDDGVDDGGSVTAAGPSTATTPAASTLPVPAVGATPAAPVIESSDGGWLRTTWRVASIVLLVLSLLGLLLAFLLMRRESRVRPRLDIARLVLVLVVAAVSMLIFSRGAPLWAVGVAVGGGTVIGYLQGSNLDLRISGTKVLGKRNATALLAFGGGLISTQVAGLLDRTGLISVGLALSFLSAATIAGLMAGRRPALAAARQSVATGVVALVLAGLVLATALPAQRGDAQEDDQAPPPEPIEDVPCGSMTPGERCAAHEAMIDLVDWTQINFNGGLHVTAAKPPITINVPRALDAPPEPISREVAWQRSVAGRLVTYAVTESFTFVPTTEGVCCSIMYTGTSTEQRNDAEPVTWAAEGQLHDIMVAGTGRTGQFIPIGGGVRSLPFSERDEIAVGDEPVCHRYVAETVPKSRQDGTFTTFTRNGEARDSDAGTVGFAYMSTACDIPGFTYDDAIAQLPPIETAPPDRVCPTRQELYPALIEGGLPQTSTATIADLFISPTEEVCSDGGLISPMMFGDGTRGGQRSEFAFDYSTLEKHSRWGDDSALADTFRPSAIDPSIRCAVDDVGRPLRIVEGERCELVTMHQLEGGGWVWIWSDNQHFDGPNTTMRVALDFATYYYRCHHCEPDDPEIARFLGSFHDFSTSWIPPDSLQIGDDDFQLETTELLDDEGNVVEVIDETQPDEPMLAEQAEELGIDPELAELFVDDDADAEAREAALAALVGLLGAAGLAGTAMAEAGLSASELAEAFRSGGIDGIDDAIEERASSDTAEADADSDEPRVDEPPGDRVSADVPADDEPVPVGDDGAGWFDAVDADPATTASEAGDVAPDPVMVTDADGDGVPERISIDTDGDGVADRIEIDADGDGIADAVSTVGFGGYDREGRAVTQIETDLDDDGVSDVTTRITEIGTDDHGRPIFETTVDTDQDGLVDMTMIRYDDGVDEYGRPITRIEIDSDGDGIVDTIGRDLDADGEIDDQWVDSDGDGAVDRQTIRPPIWLLTEEQRGDRRRSDFDRYGELVQGALTDAADLDRQNERGTLGHLWDNLTSAEPPPGPTFDELVAAGNDDALLLQALLEDVGDANPTPEQLSEMELLAARVQAARGGANFEFGHEQHRAGNAATASAFATQLTLQTIGGIATGGAMQAGTVTSGIGVAGAQFAPGFAVGAGSNIDKGAASAVGHGVIDGMGGVLGGRLGQATSEMSGLTRIPTRLAGHGALGAGQYAGHQMADGQPIDGTDMVFSAGVGSLAGTMADEVAGAATSRAAGSGSGGGAEVPGRAVEIDVGPDGVRVRTTGGPTPDALPASPPTGTVAPSSLDLDAPAVTGRGATPADVPAGPDTVQAPTRPGAAAEMEAPAVTGRAATPADGGDVPAGTSTSAGPDTGRAAPRRPSDAATGVNPERANEPIVQRAPEEPSSTGPYRPVEQQAPTDPSVQRALAGLDEQPDTFGGPRLGPEQAGSIPEADPTGRVWVDNRHVANHVEGVGLVDLDGNPVRGSFDPNTGRLTGFVQPEPPGPPGTRPVHNSRGELAGHVTPEGYLVDADGNFTWTPDNRPARAAIDAEGNLVPFDGPQHRDVMSDGFAVQDLDGTRVPVLDEHGTPTHLIEPGGREIQYGADGQPYYAERRYPIETLGRQGLPEVESWQASVRQPELHPLTGGGAPPQSTAVRIDGEGRIPTINQQEHWDALGAGRHGELTAPDGSSPATVRSNLTATTADDRPIAGTLYEPVKVPVDTGGYRTIGRPVGRMHPDGTIRALDADGNMTAQVMQIRGDLEFRPEIRTRGGRVVGYTTADGQTWSYRA